MITIYSITYNEELLMQFMIDHYRERFPGCEIVIYDNSSTDNTIEICKKNDCTVIPYESNNTLNDFIHMDIKNKCWKNSKTDWVLISDLDELLDINQSQLKQEELNGSTIIKSESWIMINIHNNYDISNMKHGYRGKDETAYDKCMLFNKKFINEINYSPGAHRCNPVGNVKYGNLYKMYHYKFINVNLEIKKRKETASRLSDINKKYEMGTQHNYLSEENIIIDFNARIPLCSKIRG